jgi:large subunit ribosomal protein L22
MPSSTAPYHAHHRFARSSVLKLRPILNLIRNRYADEAMNILKHLPHRGARMIEQVLKSAMANAENAGVREVGSLVVTDARGDGGPMFKRLMPRARGTAYMIRKRTCHIHIGLSEDFASDSSTRFEASQAMESSPVKADADADASAVAANA